MNNYQIVEETENYILADNIRVKEQTNSKH